MIGGGDSAMEDSIFVSMFAKKLFSIHRRDEYRASKIMQERARGKENIEFLTPYVPVEFVPGDDGKIAKITLQQAETGEAREIDVGGAFVAIGHRPRSELVKGQVELDAGPLSSGEPTKTKFAWVFAVGDPSTTPTGRSRRRERHQGRPDAEWFLRDMPLDPEALGHQHRRHHRGRRAS